MIKKCTFGAAFRTLPAGFCVEFKPGLNLLVGDQGSGKSTILDALNGLHNLAGAVILKDEGTKVRHFDFEKFNPRTSTAFASEVDLGVQTKALFASHGQAMVLMLADLTKKVARDPHTFLFDEPDTGLSIRSCLVVSDYLQRVAAAGHQIITSVHNPTIIMDAEQVYSVEHKQWMDAKDFVSSQYRPAK